MNLSRASNGSDVTDSEGRKPKQLIFLKFYLVKQYKQKYKLMYVCMFDIKI